MQNPPFLKKGDKIILLATSGQIEPRVSKNAAENLDQLGFVVEVYPTALSSFHYFSGDAQTRLAEFQKALDDKNCKAILCARGGFGAIHLLDKLNWEGFKANPKWLIGFSDITLLHAAIQQLKFASIHGAMAKEFAANSTNSKGVVSCLKGDFLEVNWSSGLLKTGNVEGEIIGGNLSLLTSIIGSKWEPNWENKILFVEDIGEYLYKIDRMLWTLKLRGVFHKISGLVVGQMSDVADTKIPYGKTLATILTQIAHDFHFPIAMDFPAGHEDPNLPIVLGANVSFKVEGEKASLLYLK